MHFICENVVRKHLIPDPKAMHLNRRIMRSNYRRFVGRVTDWFDAPLTITTPPSHRIA